MNKPIGTVRRCGIPDPEAWLKAVAQELREHMAVLGAAGWRLSDICAALGVGSTTLWRWRRGVADMPASKLLQLRALAAEHRKVGS